VIRYKFSSTALLAATAFAVVTLGPSSAQARQEHWFYNDYDRYDDQAYAYDEDNYDDDPVYVPSRREIRRLRRLERQRRLRRQARYYRNKQYRRFDRRPGRQSLYDVWQGDLPARKPDTYASQPAPQYQQSRPPVQLSYVPLPRRKPYHLIPPAASSTGQPVEKTTLPGSSQTATLDPRLSRNPAPEKTVKNKVEISELPEIEPRKKTTAKKVSPKKPGTKKIAAKNPEIKPIRIEVAKTRAPSTETPIVKRRKKLRPAANQLSCSKVKSIVSDFGFSDITARSCTGSVYDFSAKRDGKPYSVKVSSLSGELKDVKKTK